MNKLLLIVVIYNKSIKDLSILNTSLLDNKSIFDLYIYDNSKKAQEVSSYPNFNIYYKHNAANSGVSRAYNEGTKKAKELGKKLILVLDQDTNFTLEDIEKYMLRYNIYGNDFLYAPVICNENRTKVYSPAYLKNFVGKIQAFNSFQFSTEYSLQGKSLINSGLMIPIEIFEKIGGYNEKLKLDFSDIYFIEKYKELNPKIILVDVYLKHSISGDEGEDFAREYSRFRYYCSACKELERTLNTTVLWSPFRRLLRLILKYKRLSFIRIFFEYYLKGKEI